MAKVTFLFGILLTVLGVTAFLATGAKSGTSLIPSFVGVIMLLLSAIARKSHAANKHAMHVAALLNLVGAGAGLSMGIPNVIKYVNGDAAAAAKAFTQAGMGTLCLIFLVICIRSFIAARRARTLGA